MKPKTTALLTLLLASAPILAQDHSHHAGHGADAKTIDASTRLGEDDFDRLDADGDGYIARSELPAGHPLQDHFSMADRSRDGKLDRREFKALVGMQ